MPYDHLLFKGFLGGPSLSQLKMCYLVDMTVLLPESQGSVENHPRAKELLKAWRGHNGLSDGFLKAIFCGVLVLKELTIFPFSNL